MDFEYKSKLGKLKNESAKEVLEYTFEVMFQQILNQYDNEIIRVNVFSSLSELVKKISQEGFSKVANSENLFYLAYTSLCDALFSWIEENTEKESIYTVLGEVIENVILDCICEGV